MRTIVYDLRLWHRRLWRALGFWGIMPYNPLKINLHFRGTYRLHLQGRRINRAFYFLPHNRIPNCLLQSLRSQKRPAYYTAFNSYTTVNCWWSSPALLFLVSSLAGIHDLICIPSKSICVFGIGTSSSSTTGGVCLSEWAPHVLHRNRNIFVYLCCLLRRCEISYLTLRGPKDLVSLKTECWEQYRLFQKEPYDFESLYINLFRGYVQFFQLS
jgi:hypothetical protein